jgi:hypothetical protein
MKKSDKGPVRHREGHTWIDCRHTAFPHFFTHRMAQTALARAITPGATSAEDDFQVVAVFAAFTAEAYFNFLGQQLIPYWEAIESIPVSNKAEVLAHHVLKRKALWDRRPYQSLKEALGYRNGTAHGKPEELTWRGLVPHTRTFRHPEPDWVKCRNHRVAERLLKDVKAIVVELHKAAGLEGDPFATSGSGETVLHVGPNQAKRLARKAREE